MSDADLERFVTAQANGEFDTALVEMREGQKQSHWIWYVFPQIQGLGLSFNSRRYAIRDRDEAAAYLRHPLLGPRLFEITAVAADQLRHGVPLDRLMGSPTDAAKLISSMTLFGPVSRGLSDSPGDAFADFADRADEILAAGSAQGYPGCQHTLAQLGPPPL